MNGPGPDLGNDARLVSMTVIDEAAGWQAGGFTVADGQVRLGATVIQLLDDHCDATERDDGDLASAEIEADARGILGWAVAGLDLAAGENRLLDGLATSSVGPHAHQDTNHSPATAAASPVPLSHPNGVTGIDHVVISTPDLERTIAAFEAVGLGCRRVREAGTSDEALRQAFFRVGSVIMEVVGAVAGSGQSASEAPSTWFGLALDVDDLDATASLLGPALGRVRAAVQPGRRIATLRRRQVGMATSIAFMDHHGGR